MTEDRRDASGLGQVILVVEDEPHMRSLLRASLTAHGYRIMEAGSGALALAVVASRPPDLVLLDLGLPDVEGVELVVRLRESLAVPLIVVSARGQEDDKVLALDAGADDYLTKPFSTGELLARIRVGLRHFALRGRQRDEHVFVAGGLRVDHDTREVSVEGKSVHLTPIEYRLLSGLIRDAGRVVTQRQLLREVWGEANIAQAHYLRVYMSALRRKLEADPARPKLLLTDPAVGYRLKTD
jgi:two-component system KDP operon response regulator KdpE